jgi:hypothetical protein
MRALGGGHLMESLKACNGPQSLWHGTQCTDTPLLFSVDGCRRYVGFVYVEWMRGIRIIICGDCAGVVTLGGCMLACLLHHMCAFSSFTSLTMLLWQVGQSQAERATCVQPQERQLYSFLLPSSPMYGTERGAGPHATLALSFTYSNSIFASFN